MNEADLKITLALLEKDCPGPPYHLCKRGSIIISGSGVYGSAQVSCSLCRGTGKVPLLDPALVRKPCTCRPPELVHSETGPCRGKGWMPSNNEMDWVRALNKLNMDVAFRADIIGDLPGVDIYVGWGTTLFEAAAQALGVCATQGGNG